MNPTVSVVVVNWNGRKYLEACLTSLQEQTFDDFETIVVDNGSTDGSVNLVREEFPDVRLVALNCNRGFCGGNNIGIRHAHGDYVALLNNDTEVEADWLANLVEIIETTDADFCASKMLLYDQPKRIDTAGDYYSKLGVAGKRGHLEDESKFQRRERVFGACAGAALYDMEMLSDIGLLDEDFFQNYEDVDLSFRARLRGYECVFVPDAVVYHHLNASIGAESEEYVYYTQRNLEYVYIKNVPLSLLVRSLPYHFIYNFLALVYFTSQGRGKAFVSGKLRVLFELPALLRKRWRIQRRRNVSPSTIESAIRIGNLRAKIKKKLAKL